MTYEIENVPLPEPDGSGARGPKVHPLDKQAVDWLQKGLYKNSLEAAKDMAPKYKPNLWLNLPKEKRREFTKDKRKRYDELLTKLSPLRALDF